LLLLSDRSRRVPRARPAQAVVFGAGVHQLFTQARTASTSARISTTRLDRFSPRRCHCSFDLHFLASTVATLRRSQAISRRLVGYLVGDPVRLKAGVNLAREPFELRPDLFLPASRRLAVRTKLPLAGHLNDVVQTQFLSAGVPRGSCRLPPTDCLHPAGCFSTDRARNDEIGRVPAGMPS